MKKEKKSIFLSETGNEMQPHLTIKENTLKSVIFGTFFFFFDNAAKASLVPKSTYVRIFTKSSSVCQSMDRAFLFRG